LKEALIPETLQNAVNSVMQRLAYMNTHLHRGFMDYYHKPLKKPPKIIHEQDMPALCRYFKKGKNHLIRVIYGEWHFTVEVLHTLCDGSSFVWVIKALLVRYFELLGLTVEKDGVLDCKGNMSAEEIENALLRYKNLKKTKFDKAQDAYMPKYTPGDLQFITQNFDLEMIKALSKEQGMTISEYIISHIFLVLKKLRENEGSKKPIEVSIAVNCRRFIPTKSIQPFITNALIQMPETEEFSEFVKDIKKQFSMITSDFVFDKAGNLERLFRIGKLIPLFIKTPLMRIFGNADISEGTTLFSNLGYIELPQEIQSKVESFSFSIAPDEGVPYQFACVSTSNTLTLTAICIAQESDIIYRIGNSILKGW